MVKKQEAGYTLIETLVVVFILGLVLVVGGNLFFSILKGGAKSEAVKEIKQNGDYALAVIERMTRNAKSASCGGGALAISNFDGSNTSFSCLSNRVASGSAYLTSTNVVASSCSFTCSGANPQLVTISFTLGPAETGATTAQTFQTKVSLRTYD